MPPSNDYIDSYYQATANTITQQPQLTEELTADVCIIGGGMTGFNAAIELRKRGYEVVLLESSRISWGASGRNGGMCLVGYCLGLHDVHDTFGLEWGRKLWNLSCEALDIVRDRVSAFKIDCDLQQNCIELAINKAQQEELEAYYELMQGPYNYTPGEWWSGDKIKAITSSEAYLCGLYDSNSAHLHTLNYTIGLAQAAIGLGVKVFEQSAATKLIQGSPNLIKTENGSVKAKQVLLACNAYLDGLHRKAESTTLPVVSHIAVTEPLGDRQPITNNMAMSDLKNSLDYFRPTADGRILFGGVNHPFNGEPKNTRELIKQRMVKVFPQLHDVEMEYNWGGLFAVTREYMPQIEHLGNDVYAAHGYTGHGVSLTNIAGRVVAEAMCGMNERFDVFAKIKHKWIPTPKVLRTPALAMAIWKAELEDALAS